MADITLLSGTSVPDVRIVEDDIAVDGGLETAVLISLFTDALAEVDQLPDGETDRRGWWGDALADRPNERTGSLLWLYERETPRADLLPKIQDACELALKWLVDDGVAEAVKATATFQRASRPENGQELVLTVEIKKPQGDPVRYKFASVWPPPNPGDTGGSVELHTEDGLRIVTEAGHPVVLG
jgi:phage gp46-like protein